MEKEVIVATRIDFTWPQLIEIIGSNELYEAGLSQSYICGAKGYGIRF